MTREPLIAVIDDDEPFRLALSDSLCSLGYDVRSFESAEQFIAADGAGSFDCIITDIHMPGMSGIDLKRRLAACSCRVPVIFITARAEAGLEVAAADSGAAGLLIKPFGSDALIGCIEKVLKM